MEIIIMNKNLVEIDIVDLAFDGKSVGHMDGKVIFLKGGLPGEKVLVEITQEKRRYNQGIVREIITKSPQRIDAVCSHFGQCGGCTWQDLAYPDQLAYKQKQVNDCLERIGTLADVKINKIIGSENIFHYRNKMEYSSHTTDDSGFALGLHVRGAFDQIFNLNECHITSQYDADLVKWMRGYLEKENIPIYDVKNHIGYFRFLMLRHAQKTDDYMVNIITNYGDFPDTEKMVDELTSAFPFVTTIIHNQNGQKSNVATGEIEKVLFGPGYIEEKINHLRFQISANSFFQTNPIQAQVLYQTGFDLLNAQPTERVLDLYCGTGSIGLLLADKVKEVIGVELVGAAIVAAKNNAKINNITNAEFLECDAKKFLIENNETVHQFDIVIIDPPRAGLNPKALKHLIKLNPPKILYISCNPATFARDAKELVASGYVLPEVSPVDMFPHTMHIEMVGLFTKNGEK